MLTCRKHLALIVICSLLCKMTIASNEVEGAHSWWQKTIVYQIYPRSFMDDSGDGIGDLKGIQSRLDYLEYLNVGTVWLSPIYKSPMKDFGYDVADYRAIDPMFGSMQDFQDLLDEVHRRGMHLLMDLIPNHTSDLHAWFQKSREGGEDNPYNDYYIWSEGKVLEDGTRAPPNNWLSIFGGSAWEWDDRRQAYYYHEFVKEQPDLNFRNPKVQDEMKDVLRFWIEKGVDGFRVDAIGTLFEVEDITLDEPLSGAPGVKPFQHDYLLHPFTLDQPQIHDVIKGWREVFDEHDRKTGKHTFMVMEIYDETLVESMKYYHSGSDMPFNFNLIQLDDSFRGTEIRDLVVSWLDKMPRDRWPNYVLGNHDRGRVSSRKGEQYVNALNILLLTLPGTPTTYYGEELGMRNIAVSYQDTQDPWGLNMGPDVFDKYSRDPVRAPMQWNGEMNAGFSRAGATWLPVHPDHQARNVQTQRNDPSGRSPLQLYVKAAKLRQEPSFQTNHLQELVTNTNIFSYLRARDGHPTYLVAMNVGNETSTDNYTGSTSSSISGTVVLDSGHVADAFATGSRIDLTSVTLTPGDAIVVRLEDEFLKVEL